MNVAVIIILSLLGLLVAAVAFIANRNHMEYFDPEKLIVVLENDLPGRTLPMEGTVNFRDLGGYQTTDGQRVRTGLVYRSAALHHLTEKDHVLFGQIGIKLVCDLRGVEETEMEPDNLPQNPAPEYLHLPLTADNKDSRRERLIAMLFNRRKLPLIMLDMYTRVALENNANLYGTIFKRLANPANLPAVFHCTAGKDRTGIGAALILDLLGVPEATIIADYSLSNRYYDNYFRYVKRSVDRLRWLGIRAEHMQPLLIANPAYLRAAFKHIHDNYGSTENYLRQKAGVSAEEISSLRANLLE